MRESWQNLFDLIVNPSATFTRLKSKPRWIVVFIVFCFLSVGLAWTTAPFTEQLLYQKLAKSATSVETIGFTKKTSFVSIMVPAPVVAILWCVVLSTVLAVASRIFKINKAVKFKHIFAGIVHTSLIRTLIFLVNVGMLPVFRRIEDVEETIDMQVIPGLHMLMSSIENVNLLMFLSHLHILSIWHIFVLTIAVTIFAEVNKTKACVTAVSIWLLRVSAEVMFIAVLLP